MTHFPVVIQIGSKIERYSIPAQSPGEALNIFRKTLNISIGDSDFDGNHECIYMLNGRKRYALVFADNARLSIKKLKEKLGEEMFKRITIISITEITKEIGIEA
jgi:hypothetical protein